MSNTVQVIRNGFKIYSSQMFTTVFSMGFGIYFAHTLPKEEMAVLATGTLLTGLVGALAGLGLSDTMLREVPALLAEDDHVRAGELIRTMLVIQGAMALILAGVVGVWSSEISLLFLKTEGYAVFVMLYAVWALASACLGFLNPVLRSAQRFGHLARTTIVVRVSTRLLSAALFFPFGLQGYIWGCILGIAGGVLLMGYYSRDLLCSPRPLGTGHFRLVRYSVPYYLGGIVRYVLAHVDQYLVGLFLSPAAFATYFVASNLIEYLRQLVDAMVNPITPKLAELKTVGVARVEKVFVRTSRYFSMLFMPLCFMLAAVSPFVMWLYGGQKYVDGSIILSILAFAVLMYGFTGLLEIYVYIVGQPRDRLRIRLVGGLLNIGCGLALVAALGAPGLALSKLAAFSGSAIAGYLILKRIMRFEFDWCAVRHSTVASVVMFGVISGLQMLYLNPLLLPLYLLLGCIAFLPVFARGLMPDDFRLLGSLVPHRVLSWLPKQAIALLYRS